VYSGYIKAKENDFRVNNVAYRRYFPSVSPNRDYWDATSNHRELPVHQTKFETISCRIRNLGRTTRATYTPVTKILLLDIMRHAMRYWRYSSTYSLNSEPEANTECHNQTALLLY